MDCDHKFVFQGVVTWPSAHPRPGSSARDRIYADAYYCEKCLADRYMRERELGDTYQHALPCAVELPARPVAAR